MESLPWAHTHDVRLDTATRPGPCTGCAWRPGPATGMPHVTNTTGRTRDPHSRRQMIVPLWIPINNRTCQLANLFKNGLHVLQAEEFRMPDSCPSRAFGLGPAECLCRNRPGRPSQAGRAGPAEPAPESAPVVYHGPIHMSINAKNLVIFLPYFFGANTNNL